MRVSSIVAIATGRFKREGPGQLVPGMAKTQSDQYPARGFIAVLVAGDEPVIPGLTQAEIPCRPRRLAHKPLFPIGFREPVAELGFRSDGIGFKPYHADDLAPKVMPNTCACRLSRCSQRLKSSGKYG